MPFTLGRVKCDIICNWVRIISQTGCYLPILCNIQYCIKYWPIFTNIVKNIEEYCKEFCQILSRIGTARLAVAIFFRKYWLINSAQYCKILSKIAKPCHVLSNIVSYFQTFLDIVKGYPFLLDVQTKIQISNITCIQYLLSMDLWSLQFPKVKEKDKL